ncbi:MULTISPECIES: FecCD family ABC transporter permease [unclassified Pseudoalteromonas]|uniref:FecCD family ABC transporter permease n=1 Tax=unclassified Pseudoalteromonas TaxID=194690 RepID=UPI000C7CF5CD|nr:MULTISPECIES: iron ABC transporter permease [unclassified Pseudoalteromonas]AUJ72309.1 Hemin transport system permease protein HmuU [Pseudoalteromonas sp. NC201]MCX2767964.1 iron ABC transporter permease [Pseudoalteromonas sp. B530]
MINSERPRFATTPTGLYLIGVCMLLLSLLLSLTIGDYQLTLKEVWSVLINPSKSQASFVVWELRLPRLTLAIIAGTTLGIAGAIIQAVTQNELASPSLVGVSSGAALAIVLVLTFTGLSTYFQFIAGIFGGALAMSVTLWLSWKQKLEPVNLILSGLCVSLFCAAATTLLLISVSTDTRGLFYWLLGSVANRTWQHVSLLAPIALLGLILCALLARPLTVLQLDSDVVNSIGGSVKRWRIQTLTVAVVLTSATVAVTGPIAFVGLVAPHLCRTLLPKHLAYEYRYVLFGSALSGAVLVSMSDLLANYQEIPVGILCVLFGGPSLVWLIQSRYQQASI